MLQAVHLVTETQISLQLHFSEWNDVNCGNTNEMSINEYVTIAVNRNLSNCENSPKKWFFGASTGFKPVDSVFALQCSFSWAMKTHTLEAVQFIEFINPWKEWNTEWNDVNCGNTNEKRFFGPENRRKKRFFWMKWCKLLKLRFPAKVRYSFHLYSRSSHHFI